MDGPGRKISDPDFRALQISQHTERSRNLLFDGTNDAVDFSVIVVAAMAEVETEYVGTFLGERLDYLRRRTGRPEGRDNFSISAALHLRTYLVTTA